MTEKFYGRGKWSEKRIDIVMMSLCRQRPRDLIKLLHAAARHAASNNRSKIETQDFSEEFQGYSEERLQDLFNEFRSELPNIEQMIMQFRPTKFQKTAAQNYLYANDRIVKKIKSVRDSVNLYFSSQRVITDKSILTFLYKIDFIIARFNNGEGSEWRYFDQGRFLAHEYADFGNSWEVHPAYRWALQPNDVQAVIDTLDID